VDGLNKNVAGICLTNIWDLGTYIIFILNCPPAMHRTQTPEKWELYIITKTALPVHPITKERCSRVIVDETKKRIKSTEPYSLHNTAQHCTTEPYSLHTGRCPLSCSNSPTLRAPKFADLLPRQELAPTCARAQTQISNVT
jgi:hypothetical protein